MYIGTQKFIQQFTPLSFHPKMLKMLAEHLSDVAHSLFLETALRLFEKLQRSLFLIFFLTKERGNNYVSLHQIVLFTETVQNFMSVHSIFLLEHGILAEISGLSLLEKGKPLLNFISSSWQGRIALLMREAKSHVKAKSRINLTNVNWPREFRLMNALTSLQETQHSAGVLTYSQADRSCALLLDPWDQHNHAIV